MYAKDYPAILTLKMSDVNLTLNVPISSI